MELGCAGKSWYLYHSGIRRTWCDSIAEDMVANFFSHSFLQKSPFLLTMGFRAQHISCSVAGLLPLLHFCQVSFSHANRTINLYKENPVLRVWRAVGLFPLASKLQS